MMMVVRRLYSSDNKEQVILLNTVTMIVSKGISTGIVKRTIAKKI